MHSRFNSNMSSHRFMSKNKSPNRIIRSMLSQSKSMKSLKRKLRSKKNLFATMISKFTLNIKLTNTIKTARISITCRNLRSKRCHMLEIKASSRAVVAIAGSGMQLAALRDGLTEATAAVGAIIGVISMKRKRVAIEASIEVSVIEATVAKGSSEKMATMLSTVTIVITGIIGKNETVKTLNSFMTHQNHSAAVASTKGVMKPASILASPVRTTVLA